MSLMTVHIPPPKLLIKQFLLKATSQGFLFFCHYTFMNISCGHTWYAFNGNVLKFLYFIIRCETVLCFVFPGHHFYCLFVVILGAISLDFEFNGQFVLCKPGYIVVHLCVSMHQSFFT